MIEDFACRFSPPRVRFVGEGNSKIFSGLTRLVSQGTYKPEGEAVLRCININCAAQVVERIIHFASKDAMDIRNTLKERMAQLTPTQFERMLRPAFEQDEWILITVGALLGMAAGFAQLIFMFGGGS